MSDTDGNAGQASDGGAPAPPTEQLPDAPLTGEDVPGSGGEQGDRGATSGPATSQDVRQGSSDGHQEGDGVPDGAASETTALVIRVPDADTPPRDDGNAAAGGGKNSAGVGAASDKAGGRTRSGSGAKGGSGNDGEPGLAASLTDTAVALTGTSRASRSVSTERLPVSGKGVFGYAPRVPLHMNFRTKMEPLSSSAAKNEFQGMLDLQDSRSRAAQASHPELAGQAPPARFAVNSPPELSFVGVPARVFDSYEEYFLRDGFGGIEALWPVESLTDAEVQELADLLDPGMDLHRSVLRIQPADASPSISELHGILNSVTAKRELASLLQCYSLDGLARKVFGTSSLLKAALSQLREARRQLRVNGLTASLDYLSKDTELQQAKRDIAILNRCWEETLNVATMKREQEIQDHDRDFRRAAQGHEREEQALQLQVDKLSRENDDLRSAVQTLTARLKVGSMNVGKTMNFLNRHNTRVDGNWPRLKALLELAKDNKLPPDGWATQILVNAVDDFGAQPGAYVFADDGDDDREEKSEDAPGAKEGSRDAPLDFTQDSSAPSTPTPSRSHPTSSPGTPKGAAGRRFQLRPEVYTPNESDALDPLTPYARSVEDARASLAAHAVIWDKLRPDVQLVMRSGLDYLDAFDLVSGDNVVHPRLHVRDLLELLIRMMYWRKLNQTPWASYVPSWYYKKAEARLEQLTDIPGKWPALKSVRLEDEAEVMQAMYSEVDDDIDDETLDETFRVDKPFKAKLDLRTTPPREAKRRNSTSSTTSSAAGVQQSDSEVAPPPAKRARAAQRRTQSTLARKEYAELSPEELRIIEVPGRGVTSWRHYGILVKFQPGTARAVEQTRGFPDYTPNLSKPGERDAVRARWLSGPFRELWNTKPWDEMFNNRSKFLVCHLPPRAGTKAFARLEEIVSFMSEHRSTFWLVGHWFSIYNQLDTYSEELADSRKAECNSVSGATTRSCWTPQ